MNGSYSPCVPKTILTGIPPATLNQWLQEAIDAYRQLMIGGKPVSLSYDGKSVTYYAADKSSLGEWIQLLQLTLGLRTGRQALKIYFR